VAVAEAPELRWRLLWLPTAALAVVVRTAVKQPTNQAT
jgi:hypothetical protein